HEGSPFEVLARYVLLRKKILKNLPKVIKTIHRLSGQDGRRTFIFDTVILPRLKAHFSGGSMLAKLISFRNGLLCTQRTYVVPHCTQLAQDLDITLSALKHVMEKNFSNVTEDEAMGQIPNGVTEPEI